MESSSNCRYDYLEIYDGASSGSSKIGNRLCGSTRPSNKVSSGNRLYLKWRSDDSEHHSGFKISCKSKCKYSTNINLDNGTIDYYCYFKLWLIEDLTRIASFLHWITLINFLYVYVSEKKILQLMSFRILSRQKKLNKIKLIIHFDFILNWWINFVVKLFVNTTEGIKLTIVICKNCLFKWFSK